MEVWILSDGKAGHVNQSHGLAQALARLTPVNVSTILIHRFWDIRRAGRALPRPHFLLAAGHRTHFAALLARRTYGGKIVVLMKPTLPTGWFDLCLIPEHDGATATGNIIATRGALNPIRPGQPQAGHGLILVGGPSPHHLWDDAAVAGQVRAISEADSDTNWELTTSRRTPATFLRRLGVLPRVHTPVEQTDRDWVATRLVRAASVWVTEDSVSMIYEALTAGAAVGLLHVRYRRRSRVVRGIEQLVHDQTVTTFAEWRTGQSLQPPAVPLREADRCAAIIRERFGP